MNREYLKDQLWSIYVVLKKEFFQQLKSVRMIILMIIFSLLVLLVVYGTFMLMGMSSNVLPSDVSDLMIEQGPIFILSSIVSMIFFIGPITALALSFDSIVREKIENSLSLLLCRPISRRSIAIGKFFGTISALTVPIVLVNSIAIIIIIFLSDKGISFAQAGGFLLYTLIFLATYAALGQLISSSVKTTTTSILVGIVIWIFLPVIVSVISSFYNDLSTQISLLNPSTSYSVCVGSVLGTYTEKPSQVISLFGYYVTFIVWLLIPLLLAIEVFHRKED
jgi:ABC-2 type transport system permease protein